MFLRGDVFVGCGDDLNDGRIGLRGWKKFCQGGFLKKRSDLLAKYVETRMKWTLWTVATPSLAEWA